MTLQAFKEDVSNKGEILMFGIKFRLLQNDIVRILISNNKFEMRYSNFVKEELEFPDNILNTEISKLNIEKDEKLPHKMILVIDLRKKKKKQHNINRSGINAKMKLN